MSRNAAVGAALAEAPLELDLELGPVAPCRAGIPSEEFRTLRTRLEQLQATRAIQTVLVASPSRGDGKSFTAANLALAEAQLADNPTLLCDFDLRRPSLHRIFQIDRRPGISDYLLGQAELPQLIQRIGATSLFVMTAGAPVTNPLELLHLVETRRLLEILSSRFRSVILDSPSLLAASDASLLASLVDGTLLVARLGATKAEAMGQAIQRLGQNNILGIVANGGRRGGGESGRT